MKLITHSPDISISKEILLGNIVMVERYIDPDECDACVREAVTTDGLINHDAVYERGVSFVSTYDGGSPIGYYRFYAGPDRSSVHLRGIYEKMRSTSSSIRAELGCLHDDTKPDDYHLELLRYTKGMFFKRHVHDLEPQRVGLICLLSKEYPGQGGTVFYKGEDTIETAGVMKQGDLILFPWDTEHEVTPVMGDDRWVALLPFY